MSMDISATFGDKDFSIEVNYCPQVGDNSLDWGRYRLLSNGLEIGRSKRTTSLEYVQRGLSDFIRNKNLRRDFGVHFNLLRLRGMQDKPWGNFHEQGSALNRDFLLNLNLENYSGRGIFCAENLQEGREHLIIFSRSRRYLDASEDGIFSEALDGFNKFLTFHNGRPLA